MSTLVAPAPVATLAPGVIDLIVAQTAGAAASQTAAALPPTLTPTLTPPPTKTPTRTPSPTPTFLFILATIPKTPTSGASSGSGGSLSCELMEQSPKDNSTIGSNQSFTASWKVRNTGTSTWNSNGIDFIYVSGAKMASVKLADLPNSVAPGDSITLKLAMDAPSNSGSYKTVWTLRQGKQEFCRVNISIVVP